MTDQEKVLLLRAQNGDAEAFSQIVEAYQRQVFNLCYRMLGDPYEAEDRAKALKKVLENIRIPIYKKELIVGSQNDLSPRSANVFPEFGVVYRKRDGYLEGQESGPLSRY